MTGDLIYRKGQNKEQLEIYFIENAKTWYGCRFNSFERPK